MNSDEIIKSIYNPKRKTRQPLVFPKINKGQALNGEGKGFSRIVNRKYNHQNIFKIDDNKKEKGRIFEQDRLREFQNREYEQLQNKIAELTCKHNDDMRQIEEREKKVLQDIENQKRKQYEIKYNIWETKNEIMNLNACCLEEQKEYERLSTYFENQGVNFQYEQEDQNNIELLEGQQMPIEEVKQQKNPDQNKLIKEDE